MEFEQAKAIIGLPEHKEMRLFDGIEELSGGKYQEFERHMIETRYIGVVCERCGGEMELDVSSSSYHSGVILLNSALNKDGWALGVDGPLCPDCQRNTADHRQ